MTFSYNYSEGTKVLVSTAPCHTFMIRHLTYYDTMAHLILRLLRYAIVEYSYKNPLGVSFVGVFTQHRLTTSRAWCFVLLQILSIIFEVDTCQMFGTYFETQDFNFERFGADDVEQQSLDSD